MGAELQVAQMKYTDEACKLSAVQEQLNESTECKSLTDANAKTELSTSAFVYQLDNFQG
jgi:hypothetical protein